MIHDSFINATLLPFQFNDMTINSNKTLKKDFFLPKKNCTSPHKL